MASPPAWVIGSAARAKDEPGRFSPGPAAYILPQSVGPQPDSRKPRAGTPGFGASTRAVRETIYLGPGHDKGVFGRIGPGPAAGYQLRQAVGPQVASSMREAPRPTFSKRTSGRGITRSSNPTRPRARVRTEKGAQETIEWHAATNNHTAGATRVR